MELLWGSEWIIDGVSSEHVSQTSWNVIPHCNRVGSHLVSHSNMFVNIYILNLPLMMLLWRHTWCLTSSWGSRDDWNTHMRASWIYTCFVRLQWGPCEELVLPVQIWFGTYMQCFLDPFFLNPIWTSDTCLGSKIKIQIFFHKIHAWPWKTCWVQQGQGHER